MNAPVPPESAGSWTKMDDPYRAASAKRAAACGCNDATRHLNDHVPAPPVVHEASRKPGYRGGKPGDEMRPPEPTPSAVAHEAETPRCEACGCAKEDGRCPWCDGPWEVTSDVPSPNVSVEKLGTAERERALVTLVGLHLTTGACDKAGDGDCGHCDCHGWVPAASREILAALAYAGFGDTTALRAENKRLEAKSYADDYLRDQSTRLAQSARNWIDEAERLEGKLAEARREAEQRTREHVKEQEAVQRDLTAIMAALDISDHARPYSCHEVVVSEVIPGIERLRDWPKPMPDPESPLTWSELARQRDEARRSLSSLRSWAKGAKVDIEGLTAERDELRRQVEAARGLCGSLDPSSGSGRVRMFVSDLRAALGEGK